MKLLKYNINKNEVEIKLEFEHNQYITYKKFGKDLFSGTELSELVYKGAPTLLNLKTKMEKSEYMAHPQKVKDIIKVIDSFVGKEFEKIDDIKNN